MNIEEKQRGLAMGIYMAGTKIGPAIGAPIAAFLIAAYGWRTMFYVTGLASLVWLIPWLLLVDSDKPSAPAQRTDRQPEPPFSSAQTCFAFLLVSTQPLAEGRSRNPEAAANCAGVTEHAIRHDPAAPLAFCAILVLYQLSKPFTCGGCGLVDNAKRCPSNPQPRRSGERMSIDRTCYSSYSLCKKSCRSSAKFFIPSHRLFFLRCYQVGDRSFVHLRRHADRLGQRGMRMDRKSDILRIGAHLYG